MPRVRLPDRPLVRTFHTPERLLKLPLGDRPLLNNSLQEALQSLHFGRQFLQLCAEGLQLCVTHALILVCLRRRGLLSDRLSLTQWVAKQAEAAAGNKPAAIRADTPALRNQAC